MIISMLYIMYKKYLYVTLTYFCDAWLCHLMKSIYWLWYMCCRLLLLWCCGACCCLLVVAVVVWLLLLLVVVVCRGWVISPCCSYPFFIPCSMCNKTRMIVKAGEVTSSFFQICPKNQLWMEVGSELFLSSSTLLPLLFSLPSLPKNKHTLTLLSL